MDVENLRLFAEVARRGSFAAVARDRGGLDPSSLSRAVESLERELGLRLFQRTTRHVALTEAGSLYLARVEPLVEELDRTRDAAALAVGAVPAGTLRLTARARRGDPARVAKGSGIELSRSRLGRVTIRTVPSEATGTTRRTRSLGCSTCSAGKEAFRSS